jgi:hypothetical protein
VALTFIFLGVAYLLVSVSVSIYRQRHAVAVGTPLQAPMSRGELLSCWQELTDVTEALAKHLEKSHYLLGGYDQAEAQRWAGEGEYWRRQWRALGARCHLDRAAAPEGPKALEEMSGAYRDLGETYTLYTKDLLSFSKEQAPRLDRVRKRITRIGRRLDSASAP